MIQNTLNSKARRQHKVRAKLLAGTILPRLSVLRSNQHIGAQIIRKDGHVLAAVSSKTLKNFKGTKLAQATEVGILLGKVAKEKKIETVVFDRGSYRFHGRVQALAEAVRKSGVKF
jgi:large subunit ribosomal protein L18